MDTYIIDVREPSEFKSSHVKDAINIPLTRLIKNHGVIPQIPTVSRIIVYCNSGRRSGIAEKILSRHGYSEVIDGVNESTVIESYIK